MSLSGLSRAEIHGWIATSRELRDIRPSLFRRDRETFCGDPTSESGMLM